MSFTHARQNNAPTIIVSGLPRSGTSLMMSMLQAGGYDLVTDHVRQTDEFNPNGYFEYEAVKNLKDGNLAWLQETSGKVVKVVSPLLQYLPDGFSYRVIFMQRNLIEVLASQAKMLKGMQKTATAEDQAQLEKAYEEHLRRINEWMMQKANIQSIKISYNQLMATPRVVLEQLATFLERPLNVEPMIGMINPDLYSNRIENLSSGNK